ncbi:hypothetical protein IID19_03590 [Patescibacteria group bacterium]|nr:hypothetical protein [Patescibacteria group bacterium]
MFFIDKKKESTIPWAIFSLFFCLLIVSVLLGSDALAALSQPTDQPPENNTPGFLNIGEGNQAKQGALRLGTDDVTGPFNYQLEVLGAGAILNNAIIENNFQSGFSTATLFVDADNDRVCLGPCLNESGAVLEVSGGTMEVTAGSGSGIQAVSSDSEAVFGSGDTYGVQGIATSSTSFGIWAVSILGTAIEGMHTTVPSVVSSVAGFSDTGFAIYGENTNPSALWAGYFQGILESSSVVSGAKFLATQLQGSIVPYTSGQQVASYTYSSVGFKAKSFDGTYIYAVDASKLYKIRAADGFQIFDVAVSGNPSEVLFDGSNIWVTAPGDDKVIKIDQYSGSTLCTYLMPGGSSPQGITFDGQYYWVTASGDGRIHKINSICKLVGSSFQVTATVNSLGKIIYNGSYLWALSSLENAVININPSNNDSVRWDGLVSSNPQDIFFDNYFYWVVNKDADTLTSFYLSGTKVCSEAQETICQIDSDCTGFGGCFAKPKQYANYSTGDGPTSIAFDGTYLWVGNETSQNLSRYLAADPTQRKDFILGSSPLEILFDGTYLWVSTGTGLTSIYSGTGYGSTNLSGTLTLQNNSTIQSQSGSFSLSGSGTVGGVLTSEGNLSTSGNVWGGASDTIIPITQGGSVNCEGTANCFNCPDGYFVKNIEVNGSDQVTKIECRPL